MRTRIFISGSALANASGGALAYGIAQAKGTLAPWRILFIVEGLPTCAVAVACWFFIPDSPDKAYFLKGRDREVAITLALRQPGDRTGKQGLQWKQVLGALLDYRSKQSLSFRDKANPVCLGYIPGLIYFCINVCFASLPLFVPTIISEMGAFTSIQSNGLSAPPYLLCWIMIVTVTFISDRVNIRGPFVAAPGLVAAIGYILLGTSKTVAVRYFGLFLATQIFISVAMTLTWVGNTHATDSKRAGAFAILATFGQCGPVLWTNIFPKTDAPYYRKGMWISCCACLMVFVLACVQSTLLWRANKKRDRKYGVNRDFEHVDSGGGMGFDKRFRYVI